MKVMVLFLSTLCLFEMACTSEKKAVDLRIKAQSYLAEPIKDAEVYWDQEFVGLTDDKGELKAQKLKKVNVGTKILIKKTSDEEFFSDFNQSYLIEDHKKSSTLYVTATLYFVPKNSAKKIFPSSNSSNQEKETSLPAEQNIENSVNKINELPTNVAELSSDSKESDAKAELSEPLSITAERPVEVPEDSGAEMQQDTLTSAKEKRSPKIVTVHLSKAPNEKKDQSHPYKSQAHHLESGFVRIYRKNQRLPITSCTTNERGRCAMQLNSFENEDLMIVASKYGFLTATSKFTSKKQSLIFIAMKEGLSFDMFAFEKIFQREKSLSGLTLKINGKKVSSTNEFGFVTWPWNHKDSNLSPKAVILTEPDSERVLFESQFQVPPKDILVKLIDPQSSPKANFLILEPEILFAKAGEETTDHLEPKWDYIIEDTLKKSLAKHSIFQEYPLSLAKKYLNSSLDVSNDKSAMNPMPENQLSQVPDPQDLNIGALSPLIAASIDAVIMSQLRPKSLENAAKDGISPIWELEIRLLNGQGQTLSGVYFDFEGVDSKLPELTKSNWDRLRVLVTSYVEKGAMILMEDFDRKMDRSQKNPSQSLKWLGLSALEATHLVPKKLPFARLYGDGRFLAQSNIEGQFVLPIDAPLAAQRYKVVRSGYLSQEAIPKIFETESQALQNKQIFPKVILEPDYLLVKIESSPPLADVFLNGQSLGRTPLRTLVNRKNLTRDLHLRLTLGSGYKEITKYLGLPNRPLVFAGTSQIVFEQDILAKGERLVRSGRISEALLEYEKVSPHHSDYQESLFRAAEINLFYLDNSAKAARYFEEAFALGLEEQAKTSNISMLLRRASKSLAHLSFYQEEKSQVTEQKLSDAAREIDDLSDDSQYSNEDSLNSLSPEQKKLLLLTKFMRAWVDLQMAQTKSDTVKNFLAHKKWREFQKLRDQERSIEQEFASDPQIIFIQKKIRSLTQDMAILGKPQLDLRQSNEEPI